MFLDTRNRFFVTELLITFPSCKIIHIRKLRFLIAFPPVDFLLRIKVYFEFVQGILFIRAATSYIFAHVPSSSFE